MYSLPIGLSNTRSSLISLGIGMQYLPNAGNCDDACNTTKIYPSLTSGDVKDITNSLGCLFLHVGGIVGGPPFLLVLIQDLPHSHVVALENP